ncbi:MAG: hypothetical protein KJ720_15825 [Proteobacteria bacterium]|nr:hypothetical protein [Pseudomonadota bacterium]MBU1449602.1 hypothetical protein [Pseudomonadota bacterium]MBU2469721.1 hypothetical protein [Pseudomonadota bacterium]MBU2517325.1 hypothetical protein [Pseudomonadota bacterium]
MDKHDLQAPSQGPAEILKLAQQDSRRAEALWHGLSRADRQRTVLAAQGMERERLIVLAADSRELTQELPPDEFAATVLEMGPEDAGALIELCSDEQLTYLLDLTGWQRESFAPERYQVWLPIILEAGAHRLQRWLATTDLEVLALLLNHWVRVVKFLPSQEQQEPPDDLPSFTVDGVYFIDFINPNIQGFVAQVLVLLRSELPDLYYQTLEAALWEHASELQEYASRWRSGRLADHGFPNRLEALELWSAPAPGETNWQKLPLKAASSQAAPRSDRLAALLPDREFLPALAGQLGGEAADMLKAEMAYIASCGVAALEADPASPEEVERAAKESLGLVNLGLVVLAKGDPVQAREIVTRLSLAALARHGATAVRGLNRRAWVLAREGWLAKMPTGLHILEPPLDRWLAGLLYARPRCHDPNLGQSREYRAFVGQADLEAAGDALDQAEFWGVLLLELLALDPLEIRGLYEQRVHPADITDIKLSHILGTWLARREMGLEGLAPIPAEVLPQAVAALQKALAGGLDEELADSLRALPDPAQAALAGRALRGVLHRLSQELSGLDPQGELDPRFIAGLVVEA